MDASVDVTRAIARQYDLFQASLELIAKERPFLNYGFTITGRESYEDRQQQLCLEVFAAAGIRPEDVIVDVGFGTGEQDILLARTHRFAHLTGFNVAERQVAFARARVAAEGLGDLVSLRSGEAETMPGIEDASVDRVLAIECAFYFDRPRFYRRAAEVLRPRGLAVLADIALADRLAFLTRRADLRRVGTRSANRAAWEPWFRTRSVRSINVETRPGAQMSVRRILSTLRSAKFPAAQRREWRKMALSSQVVAIGLATGLLHYDLIVLEKL